MADCVLCKNGVPKRVSISVKIDGEWQTVHVSEATYGKIMAKVKESNLLLTVHDSIIFSAKLSDFNA
jgi:hypothetical protein